MKVEISNKLFGRLQQLSTPLIDTIDSVISKLLDFFEENKKIDAPKDTERPASRVTQDDLIPFIIFLLQKHGGKLHKLEVEDKIKKKFEPVFDKEWYYEKVSKNIPRWKHHLAWAKERAKKAGLVKKPQLSGYGYWELTEAAHRIDFGHNIEDQITSIESIKRVSEIFNKKVSELFNKNKLSTSEKKFYNKIDVVEITRPNVTDLLKSGHDFDKRGEFELALQCYTAAIAIEPLNTSAYYSRAEIYEDLWNLQGAISDYRKIIEIEPPNYGEFYANLGIMCGDSMDDESAIFYYSKAIELSPAYPDFYFYRSCALERKKKWKQAFIDVNHALKLNPNEETYIDSANNLYKKILNEKDSDDNPRILIVDDDEAIVSSCREFFCNEGYETHTAHVSEEALKFLAEKSVDVVITGVNQPSMSGLELTKIIKEKYDTEVIIFTGYKEGCSHEKARAVGASDLLYKPVRLVDLLDSVKKVIERRLPTSTASKEF